MGTESPALPTVASLLAAERALAEERRADALASLLEAWRATRHPRIANLIDFVSDELVAKHPPIRGKTLAARMQVWHELEQQRDPALLGRLLATPWPGTWQSALPMLEPLCQWPDDPRLSLAFARVVDACPYDTWTASKFYGPMLRKLDEQRDLRVLPILCRQSESAHSMHYRRTVRPLVAASIRKLQGLYPEGEPPALPADVVDALALAEAHYRERIEGARVERASEAEHLAAIHADPEDLAARAVYADWLGDHGDPRGELITLQLARASGTATDAALARERKLLAEHGKRWAGELDAWFEDSPRSFEGGFLVGGSLRWRYQYGAGFSVERMLRDPGWALVRVLWTRGEDELLRELIDRPELRSLREVHVMFDTAAALAAGPPRNLQALHWRTTGPQRPLDALATCEALPELVEVGFISSNVAAHAAWIAEAPVVERLARLVVHEHRPEYLEAAAQRAGTLREIEIDLQRSDRRDEGWRFLLQRDAAPGPFTRLLARSRGGPHDPSGLVPVLKAIPKHWLRELVVTSPKKLALPKQERAELAAAIGQFSDARCELPWDLAAPVPISNPASPLFQIRVDGESLFKAEKAEAVWRLVNDDLGLAFDSFEIGSKWRPLGDDPVARIQKWAGNARCYDMTLFRDGDPSRLRLMRSKYRDVSTTLLEAPVVALRSHEEWIAWFLRLVELGTFEAGGMHASGADRHYRAFDLGATSCAAGAGWLIYFGPLQKPLLPIDRIAALASRPNLDGVFAHASSAGVLVGAARSPQEVTAERIGALAAGLREILHASLEERFGFSLETTAQRVLGGLAAQHGMTLVPEAGKQFQLRFASADRQQQLHVTMFSVYERPQVRVQLHSTIADRIWFQDLGEQMAAGTRDELEAALAHSASLIRQYAKAFFADPASSRRYR